MPADRGYDHDKYRHLVCDLGVRPLIARLGTEHGSGVGAQRWVVQRAFGCRNDDSRLAEDAAVDESVPYATRSRRGGG